MEVTLTKIYREDKPKKDGSGTWPSITIYTKQHEQRLGGYGNEVNAQWKAGDTVEIAVKENGKYLNFEATERKPSKTWDKINELEGRLQTLEKAVLGKKPPIELASAAELEADEVPGDLPF